MFRLRFLLVLLVSSVLANLAFAAPTKNGLVLIAEGDRDIQREVAQAVLREMRTQAPDDLLDAMAAEGVTGSVSDALMNARTRKKTIAAIQKAMRKVGAGAVLSVRGKRNRAGEREMHVVLLVPTQAGPMIEEDLTLPANEKTTVQLLPLVSDSLPELVRSASTAEAPIAAAPPIAPSAPAAPSAAPAAPAPAAPAPATPAPALDEPTAEKPSKRAAPSEPATVAPAPAGDEPTAEKPSKRGRKKGSKASVEEEPTAEEQAAPAPASERDRVKTGKRAVDFTNASVIIEGGFGLARRQLQYSDPWAGQLRPYLAPAIGMYSVGVELYPGASSNMEVLKDIGVVGRYAGSLSVESVTSDGQKVNGSFQRYALGVRARIPTGDRKRGPLVGLEATYGLWNYAFTGTDEAVDQAPSVRYTNIRAGVDARLPYGPWAVLVGAGYMNISSAGTLNDRFPNLTVAGIDAMGGGTFRVAPPVELRLLLSYARFFSNANPEPGADYIAGGTLDQYVTLTFGASTIF